MTITPKDLMIMLPFVIDLLNAGTRVYQDSYCSGVNIMTGEQRKEERLK